MIITSQQLVFRELMPEDGARIRPFLEQAGSQSCDYSFSTLYLWRRLYGNRVACDENGAYYFENGEEGPGRYLHPVGPTATEQIERLLCETQQQHRPLCLYGGDETAVAQLEKAFPARFDRQALPAEFDYLYRREDLVALSGKRYDGKRNHIRAFSRRFSWQYESLNETNAEEFIQTAACWLREKKKNDPALAAEQEAIRDAVTCRTALGTRGALIRVDGRPVAMTLGAPIRPDTFDIQVEKALAGYAEAYAVINREFAARELTDMTWINRENDMGLEGIRRAKQSYHPVRLISKYLCTERM